MYKKEVVVDWNTTKDKLKKKFAVLGDNDLILLDGKKEEISVRLQFKLGKTKEELEKIILEL